MKKEQLKSIIKQAVEKGPFKKDIKKLSLFGSYLKGTPKKGSDIDLLVEFSPKARIGFFKLIGIQENLEKAVGQKIDLLTPEGLSKYFRDEILKTAEPVYEG